MVENHHNGSGTQNNYNANSQNVNHEGDQIVNFVENFNTSNPNSYKNLWSAIAGVGASHTAEQQYERGECLGGTRVELRRMIRRWRQAGRGGRNSEGEGSPLCWLAGAAGVGKTAIAMSVAKELEKEGALVSSFFFFRSDPKRNNPQALWLTIAHGLISTMPFMRRPVEQRISEDPKILEARLEDQFQELVLNPFLEPVSDPSSWQKSLWAFLLQALYLMLSSVMLLDVLWGLLVALIPDAPVQVPDKLPNIIIIDGLDECGDESTQLRILSIIRGAVQQSPHFPLRFLICSRPEAWIKEVFDTEHFRRLSKVILVDDALEDIIKYCHHHFQEIVSNPKYKNVPFPSPWPSQEDFGTLVDRSCSQFIYVTTVFRFITLAGNHPVNKLRLILNSSPSNQPGLVSPFPELDALYYTILKSSPNPEDIHAILVAILVLPGYLEPTPAHIELLLGQDSGQADLTLRGLHSVLRISGYADGIQLYHNSFREYLIDRNRSQSFYVDLEVQEHIVAQQWLQGLTTDKMLTYSFDQLYDEETSSFFTKWRSLCTSLAKPTRSLLEHLQNVDLASVFLCGYIEKLPVAGLHLPSINTERRGFLQWSNLFEWCHSWVKDYYSREPHSDDLVKGLLVKLAKPPKCFHLIRAPGVGRRDDATSWVIRLTSGCRLLPTESRQSEIHRKVKQSGIRLTDCNCDPTKREQSDDPGHLAYQEVCMELLTDFTSELDRSDDTSPYAFMNVVASLLLEHCRPDAELLSLCHTFLDSARRCSELRSSRTARLSLVGAGRLYLEHLISLDPQKTLLERIEAIKFPMNLAGEVEALKEQVLALPWDEWLGSGNELWPSPASSP
ncbi:hypothetical protein PM082_023237 [Marasmius tenuissimus]|nr:hypothetical protein PM082_023237 [Marasmius tenuissimus]